MDFKAKRRKVRVEIDGKIYDVNFPKIFELKKFREDVKGKSDSKTEDMLSSFLEHLGLPYEAQAELEGPDLGEIVALLTDQKKV